MNSQVAQEIVRLEPKDFRKCGNIWDMTGNPERAKSRYEQLISGRIMTWVYTENGEFLGEGSLVPQNDDPDYTIPGRRIYFSHLVVKNTCRSRGIGGILIDYIVAQAENMGYCEISIGVNKDNTAALSLYRKKGFGEVIFDGEDEYGEYYKLLKKLDHKPRV